MTLLRQPTLTSVTEAPITPAQFGGDLQKAVTRAARAVDGQVYLTHPVNLSGGAQITIPGPVTIYGANRPDMTITQTGSSLNAFVLARDTANSEAFTRGVILANLKIVGPGNGTSTGSGVLGVSGDEVYQGNLLTLRNVTFSGWDVGVRLHRWDNVEARQVALDGCRVGWYSDGNANSHHLQVSATTCTEAAVRLGDGAGGVIHGLDMISCGQALDLLDQSQCTLLGGNFESCTGSQAFIHVANGAKINAWPGRFLKNVGNDVPGFLVENGGLLVLNGAPAWAGFTTNKLIKKNNNSATVYLMGPTRNFSAAPEAYVDDVGNMSYPASPWATRQENAVPAASINTRNQILGVMGRDASNTEDELIYYLQDKSSGTAAYSARSLARTITGTGSPETVVAARPGTLYLNKSGGTGTTLYVKETGNSNTGWVAK